MAPVVVNSGTQTCSVGTEHTLVTQSSAKTCVMTLSLTNMVAGDLIEIRVYDKGLTGDTITTGTLPNLLYYASYQHAQSEPIVQTVPVPIAYAGVFTVKQTAGTGRDVYWHVVSLD